jgi:hypothetical protein
VNYAIAIKNNPTGLSPADYRVRVNWDKLGGGTGQVTVYYRVAI